MVGIIVLLSIRKHMFSPYKEISKYVTQNEATLRMDCERYLEQKYVNQSDDEVKATGIYKGDTDIVQYDFSGKGIAPASIYYGFYYSPDDIPVPYDNADYDLELKSADEWTWDGVGDNGGIIRKICENWYYYEAWF